MLIGRAGLEPYPPDMELTTVVGSDPTRKETRIGNMNVTLTREERGKIISQKPR